MKTIEYDNKTFWQVTDRSAIRHHNSDRIEVLTWKTGGEVQYKSRTVSPSLYAAVKSTFEARGLA